VGAWAQKPAFSRKPGSSEATRPPAQSLGHAGGCPLTPKSAIESHLGFAESLRVREPIPKRPFAAVAALPHEIIRCVFRCKKGLTQRTPWGSLETMMSWRRPRLPAMPDSSPQRAC
jgi:hypothetical protein